MKSLVVYYSRSGNTRFVAEKISQKIGGDIEEIIDKKRRKGPLGFVIGGFDATRGRKTDIAEMKKSPRDYDLIVVGTPMWNKRITPAVRKYLEDNKFSEKRVALFCTNNGSQSERVFKTLKEIMPGCIFVGELAISNAQKDREDTDKKISEWLKSLKI
jgi:flavodoxin